MRSAVILAGGKSSRLGEEKSLLEFDGRPLICWTVQRLSSVADEIVVVARDEAHSDWLEALLDRFKTGTVLFTWDNVPGYGPVAGLYSGMRKASGEYAFATACDLPFLSPKVVDLLFRMAQEEEESGGRSAERGCGEEKEGDAGNGSLELSLADGLRRWQGAVPVQPNGFFEPLHCIYEREAMQDACLRAIKRGERRIHAPLQELRIRRVPVEMLRPLDPELLTFYNLNTREELERARELWQEKENEGS